VQLCVRVFVYVFVCFMQCEWMAESGGFEKAIVGPQ